MGVSILTQSDMTLNYIEKCDDVKLCVSCRSCYSADGSAVHESLLTSHMEEAPRRYLPARGVHGSLTAHFETVPCFWTGFCLQTSQLEELSSLGISQACS